MNPLRETPVVTCFLRHDGEVLLLRRSSEVGSYAGRWGAVAGFAEGDPDAAARREIAEEAGLGEAVTLVRRGEPFSVEDRELERRWIVHPYLFDCSSRQARLDWESTEAEWVSPTEILRRHTVPRLWTSWDRVRPTVQSVAQDREHGSAYVSLRAIEVLRDRAGELVTSGDPAAHAWQELTALARRLLDCRPSMAAVENRIHRVMHAARRQRDAPTVESAAIEALSAACAADRQAAAVAAERVAGRRVLSLSRSGTVERALLAADPRPAVFLAESRPGAEGVVVAGELARHGLEVTLLPDAAMARVADERRVEVVLIGADKVLASGAVVNKTGSRLAALVARELELPFYVVTARDKVSVEEDRQPQEQWEGQLYEGEEAVQTTAPLFEAIAAAWITSILTENGAIDPSEVPSVAEELRSLRDW